MEKGKKNKKQIIIGGSILLIVTLLLLGLTYAYYRTKIIGNSNNESVNVLSKNLSVTYQDGDNSIINNGDNPINPGFTATKTFSVENTGSAEATYSIKLDNVENNFIRLGDWTYKLYKDNEKDKPIAEGIIGHNKEQTIKSYETVTDGGTNTYTLEIEYANSKEDQSIDMGKSIKLRVNIDNSIGDNLVKAASGTLLHAIGRDNNIVTPPTIPGKEASGYYKGAMGELIQEMTVSSYNQKLYWTYGEGYEYDRETEKYSLTDPKTLRYNEGYNNLVGKYIGYLYGSSSDTLSYYKNLDYVYQVVSVDHHNDGSNDIIRYKTSIREFEEAELSYTEDDYGTSYYYRGKVENNYVTFANKCWRVVRVQGDGSIKITLYDEQHTCEDSTLNRNGAFISEQGDGTSPLKTEYNTSYSSKTDVKFGTSTVHNVLGDWYGFSTVNLSTYEDKIEQNAEWCNDVSVAETHEYGGIDYGASKRLYGSNGKDGTGPSLKCPDTTETDMGSSIYVGKIGLLSADEVAYAGSSYSGNKFNYYLQENADGNHYWTLSPYDFDGSSVDAWRASWTGSLTNHVSYIGVGEDDDTVRPALVLKPNVTISDNGNGTKDKPYVISEN